MQVQLKACVAVSCYESKKNGHEYLDLVEIGGGQVSVSGQGLKLGQVPLGYPITVVADGDVRVYERKLALSDCSAFGFQLAKLPPLPDAVKDASEGGKSEGNSK